MSDRLRDLYESLDRRSRPEPVAAMVAEILPEPSRKETSVLARITPHARYWSSMSEDFDRPRGVGKPLATAAALSGIAPPDATDLAGLAAFLESFEATIAKAVGRSDFKRDRLNRERRRAAGLGEMSRRQYNKRFRLAARLERKRARLGVALEKRGFVQMSKSRMAARIAWEDFSADVDTACFLAYYAARCNLRSLFTNQAQARPYDEFCDLLFRRLRSHPLRTNWWAVALAYPDRAVLGHLPDARKGQLLGLWYDALDRLAALLGATWEGSDINRDTMIVRKGNDSSTWNTLAGAWNKARDAWINLLYAIELESLLDEQCPGKVLRLMAADVAYWHRATGGDLDPNTLVWREVPLPWQVFSGDARCGKAEVVTICERHGLDPYASGWAGPKPTGDVHPFTPTPELVHGVAVASPQLALVFRKAGVFSGKATGAGTFLFADEMQDARAAHWRSQGPLAKGAKDAADLQR